MANFTHIQHKKSKESGKAPSVGVLYEGELAVNYHKGTEAIYLQNDNNEIVKIASSNSDASANLTEITYSELKALKNAAKLVKGTMYRITDYKCTAKSTESQPDVKALEHQFDIIVTAIDETTLNENAWAAHHSGDTYFANSDLNAWELKYSFDNDIKRFDWADTDNGKGVIYYMKDEWNNECPYDFKNIQFGRVKVKADETHNNLSGLTGGYYGVPKQLKYKANYMTGLVADTDTTVKYFYTFHVTDTETNEEQDASVSLYEQDSATESKDICVDNAIKPAYMGVNGSYTLYYNKKMMLPNMVFLNKHTKNRGGNFLCCGNVFGINCYENTFGEYCFRNLFGNYLTNNTFGEYFKDNLLGNNNYSNTFGNSTYSNIIGNDNYSNTFGDYFYRNSLGNNSYKNTFGDHFQANTIGNFYGSNSLGNSCYYNSFGNNVCSIKFIGDYYRSNIVENDVQYVDVNYDGTSSSSNTPKNFTLSQGMTYTSGTKKTITVPLNSNKKTVYGNGAIDYIDANNSSITLSSDKFVGMVDSETY